MFRNLNKSIVVFFVISLFVFSSADVMAESIVGIWVDDAIGQTVTITQSDSGYSAQYNFRDGSSYSKKLIPSTIMGRLAFREKGNEAGEFYLLETSGNLGSYDPEGLIVTLREIK